MKIKYLLRLKTINKGRLLFNAYQEQIENLDKNDNWLCFTKHILDHNGFSYLFVNQMKPDCILEKNVIKNTSNKVKNRIKDIFEQNIMYHIKSQSENNKGKLVFYGKLKEIYKKENYLNIKNVKLRKIISNIRMSTHKLEIETGRYKNIDKDKRVCNACNLSKTESEEHFLLECPKYSHHRKYFSEEIKSISKIDLEKNGIEAIKNIFLQENLAVINKFGYFVKQCWITRSLHSNN